MMVRTVQDTWRNVCFIVSYNTWCVVTPNSCEVSLTILQRSNKYNFNGLKIAIRWPKLVAV